MVERLNRFMFIAFGLLILAEIVSAGEEADILLKCENTDEYTSQAQDMYVTISGLQRGSIVKTKNIYASGEDIEEYHVTLSTDELIIAEMHLPPNSDAREVLVKIDRHTGRMTISSLFPADNLSQVWNSEKNRIGGFDKDTWFSANWDCVTVKEIF